MAPSDTRVILITPPPLNDFQWGKRVEIGLPADREFEVTRKYAEAAKAVGEKEGIPVVDVWTAIWEAAGKEQEGLEKYLIDGLHLTVAGYNVGSDFVSATLFFLVSFPRFWHPVNFVVIDCL